MPAGPTSRPSVPSGTAESPGALAVLVRIGRVGGPRLGLIILVVLHALLLAVALTVGRALPREPYGGNWEELIYSGPGSQFISFWQRWDALWYQHIAEEGYRAGNGTSAFYPLFPLIVRGVSALTLGNTVLAGLVVSAVAFVAVAWLTWRLIALEAPQLGWPDSPALPAIGVLLLAAFPTGFFLLAPYTEGLFLALALATFYSARTGRPWAAGILGLFAALSRPQGVFLALPIAWEVLRQGDGIRWLLRRGGRRPAASLLAALLPVAGLVGLTSYQRAILEETRTGLEAQTIWGYQLVLPWDAVGASWSYVIDRAGTVGADLVEALNLASLLGGVAIAIIAARRLPLAYALYALPSMLLLAVRQMSFSPLMSVTRYVLVVFPLFLVATGWLGQRPRLAVAVIVAGLLVEMVLFQYFVRWGFVG